MYRHTQTGRFMLAFTLTVALGQAAVAAVVSPAARLGMLVGAGLALLIGLPFSRLTTEVRDGVLRFHFGPGIWRKRFRLDDVVAAELARSRWWEGIGVRFTTRGMLYTVATGPALEIRLRSGTRFRLGTDEPERLRAALGTSHDGAPHPVPRPALTS